MKLVLVLSMLIILGISLIPSATNAPAVSSPILIMQNTTHGNGLNGQVQVGVLGGGCYFPIIINITITYLGNSTYPVTLQSFALTTLSITTVISNSTNYNLVTPNNRIDIFYMLKQPNNNVVLTLTFQKLCILGSLYSATLIYNDGQNTFSLIN